MPEGKKKTRAKSLSYDDPHKNLPDLKKQEYLFDAFLESGMSLSGVNGAEPLTWTEIVMFNGLRDNPLTKWELRQIFIMSQHYVSWMIKGVKESNPPHQNDDEMRHDANNEASMFKEKAARHNAKMRKVKNG